MASNASGLPFSPRGSTKVVPTVMRPGSVTVPLTTYDSTEGETALTSAVTSSPVEVTGAGVGVDAVGFADGLDAEVPA